MSCYRPMVGLYTGELNENGKKKYEFRNIKFDKFSDIESLYPGSVLVPCGHCIGCRLDYSRRWADRMLLEYESSGRKGVFVTLTYDCRHVPDVEGLPVVSECFHPEVDNSKVCPCKDHCSRLCRLSGSLFKKHLQDWMKRLRKELSKSGITIKFYACGEYGSFENTHRPHYHLVLFGCSLSDFEPCGVAARNELGDSVYQTRLTDRTWPYGFSSVGNVSWSACAYVSRYVQKKAYDLGSDSLNEMLGVNPEFSLMSRRPGLGRQYLDEHPDCLDYVSIPVSTDKGSKSVFIPKYFVNTLELSDPDRYAKIMEDRKRFASDRMLSELQATDLGASDYLKMKESKKLEQVKGLRRVL